METLFDSLPPVATAISSASLLSSTSIHNSYVIYHYPGNLLQIQGILRLGAGGLRIKIQQCASYLTGVSTCDEWGQREGINDLATSPQPGVPSSSSSFCFSDISQVYRVVVQLVGSSVGDSQAVNESRSCKAVPDTLAPITSSTCFCTMSKSGLVATLDRKGRTNRDHNGIISALLVCCFSSMVLPLPFGRMFGAYWTLRLVRNC